MKPSAASVPEDLNVRRAASRTAALAIVHALLVCASYFLLLQAPGASASDEEFVDFYGSSADRRLLVVAGFYLMPFAGIAFMWFIVALRVWIRGAALGVVDEMYSGGQLVSGIVFLALFFTAAAAVSVLAVSAESSEMNVDPAMARQFTDLGWALVSVFAMRMGAVFVITTSALGRRHGFLPGWFVIVGYLIGVFLLLSASVSALFALVMPLWMLVLGGLLLMRARSLPAGPLVGGAAAPPSL
jgi:hypothetical protein